MLKAVRDLGEFLVKKRDLDSVDVLIESHKLEAVDKVICVVFETVNESFRFKAVHTEEYDSSKTRKYLYRTFPHGQYDVMLTSKFAKADPNFAEKFEKRWNLWFKKFYEKYNQSIIESLKTEFEDKKEKILKEILNRYNTDDKKGKNSFLVTIRILDEDGKEKYLFDIEIFRKIFVDESTEYFYHKHETYSKGKGICCLCSEDAIVYGFASPFSVFTVDKKGFAYDFSRENSWKQLPICKKCAIYSNLGKKFLEEHLRYNLYKYYYYVIPRFIQGEIGDDLIEELEFGKGSEYHESLMRKCHRKLLEDDILDIIKEKKDEISLIFVFFKPTQKDFFNIVNYVEDVPPSWIKKMSDTFCQVNSKFIFKENYLKILLGKNWSEEFLNGNWKGKKIKGINMGGITREFFPENYINIIGDIFGAKLIEKDYLIGALLSAIRKKYVNNRNWDERLLAIKSIYFLIFLIQIGLLARKKQEEKFFKEVSFMETEEKEEGLKTVENFFRDFSMAFDTPDKKAVFLEGALTRLLLNIQSGKRGSTPFRSKLSGLRLNQRKVKRLLPEIMEKFTSYKVFKYRWLEELVSKFFIEADESGWMISDNEISYYFALGLNLGQIFKGGD